MFHLFLPLIHLGLVLADDEPAPVHGDGDHRQGGHEGRHAGNRASQSENNVSGFIAKSLNYLRDVKNFIIHLSALQYLPFFKASSGGN